MSATKPRPADDIAAALLDIRRLLVAKSRNGGSNAEKKAAEILAKAALAAAEIHAAAERAEKAAAIIQGRAEAAAAIIAAAADKATAAATAKAEENRRRTWDLAKMLLVPIAGALAGALGAWVTYKLGGPVP